MTIIYLPQREPSPVYKELGTVILCPPGRKPEFIHGADAVLVTGLEPVTRKLIEHSPALRMVASLTTGTDHIDVEALKERGIPLITLLDCPGYAAISGTAEHTWGLILALARGYRRAFDNKERVWGNELQGKTLGIVGYGRIGKILATYADAFGMFAEFYDPYKEGDRFGTKFPTLADLFAQADIIAITCNLTPETEGMIGIHELKRCEPGAYLVNTARPQIVAPGALQMALASGFIAGAAYDFNTPETDHCRELGYNIVTTPHIGGATYEGNDKADALIAAKLKEILHEYQTNKGEKETGTTGLGHTPNPAA